MFEYDKSKIEEYEFYEYGRKAKIEYMLGRFGADNFYVAYSGGKDSNVLSYLIDLAVPGNKIPRVYCDTGIELNAVRDFVVERQKTDSRIHLIQPSMNIKEVLEKYGYPFKSKQHAQIVGIFQRSGYTKTVRRYLGLEEGFRNARYRCPKILECQFKEGSALKISDKCCLYLKEKPLNKWKDKMNFPYRIVGLRHDEGGRRKSALCTVFNKKTGDLKSFAPLVEATDDWENYFIEKYSIKLPIRLLSTI